jgi:hypothetical protein
LASLVILLVCIVVAAVAFGRVLSFIAWRYLVIAGCIVITLFLLSVTGMWVYDDIVNGHRQSHGRGTGIAVVASITVLSAVVTGFSILARGRFVLPALVVGSLGIGAVIFASVLAFQFPH